MSNKKIIIKNTKFKKHKISNHDDSLEIEKKIKKNIKNNEIEEDLMEIYKDEKGNISDLSEIKMKKKKPFILRLFLFLFFLSIIFVPIYFIFNYFYSQKDSSFVLDVKISAPSRIVLGEEFFYEIEYLNSSDHVLKNIRLEMNYPDSFVFLESYPEASFNNNVWEISSLNSGESSRIKVRGFIINQQDSNNLLSLNAGYEISGFSSYFRKEFFYSLNVSSLPFNINLDFSPTVLIGEEYELVVNLENFTFLKDKIILSFNAPDNIEFFIPEKEPDNRFRVESLEKNSFSITNLTENNDLSTLNDYNLYFKYRATDKNDDRSFVSWNLKYVDENERGFYFYENNFYLNLIKSDLHLNLIINQENIDQAVNFGDTLYYTIEYANKGDKKMTDVVLMLVIDSDFLDWSSLKDLSGGTVRGGAITWTSEEIPALKELVPGEEHSLDLSINVADFDRLDFGQELHIKSYAQFTIGNISDFDDGQSRISDNKSNTITNKINSNLSFNEKIKYFDENNIPVGSGPLPPRIGERSSFRVYWEIENTLHELNDLRIELNLPENINWENNYNISAGEINYDPDNHRVVWTLARLPLGVNSVNVDFDISIIPTELEYNRIIILSPGTSIEVLDAETRSIISKKTDVKTTKLEDDSIAQLSSDGIIRR